MDVSGQNTKVNYLHRKRTSVDGVTTIEYKIKPKHKRKIILAKGSNHLEGSHSVGTVVISQLIPFRKSMIYELNKKGFNTSKLSFRDLVALYYNEFVSNQHNKSSPFVPINSYEFVNNLAFKVHPKDNLIGDITDFRNAEGLGQVGNITDNIINTYKFSRSKYKRALQDGYEPKQVLTDVELRQAKAVERVERELNDKMKDNFSVKQGTVKKLVIWVVVLYLFYYLFLK